MAVTVLAIVLGVAAAGAITPKPRQVLSDVSTQPGAASQGVALGNQANGPAISAPSGAASTQASQSGAGPSVTQAATATGPTATRR